jgi:hypothetical protein
MSLGNVLGEIRLKAMSVRQTEWFFRPEWGQAVPDYLMLPMSRGHVGT